MMRRALLTVAVTAAALPAITAPAAVADPAPTPISSLPFTAATGGGTGTATGNDAVAARCNRGAPIRSPKWFALRTDPGGPVYARATATQPGRITASIPVGLALIDAGSGSVLGCASGRPAAQLAPITPAAGQQVDVVAFLPEPYEDGTGDGASDFVRVLVDRTSGTAPTNDLVPAARQIGSLPLEETVDTTLADDDEGGLGGCHWAPRHTAWWTYSAHATGKLHVSVTSDLPAVTPDTWPGASLAVAEVTDAGPVQVLPAPSDEDCVTPVSSGEVSLEPGARYLIGAFVAEDPPEPSLVLGGRLTLSVVAPAAPTAPTAPPSSVTASTVNGPRTATLGWGPPADDGGSPITGYRVSRDGPAPASHVLPATARSFVFGHLRPWRTYHLSVQALNAVGAGPAATVGVLTKAATPSAPTGVRATARDHAATVRWTAPDHSGDSPVTRYRIRRYAAHGTRVLATAVVPGTSHRTVVGHLHKGRSYRFDVTAVNSSGHGSVSARSNAVTPTHRGTGRDCPFSGVTGRAASWSSRG
ncbi:MAG TPA: fibronectin type III domain-containing protein [Actinomycetales bacterium]|nr:fibronectin type III domain-containing protein [Actinomycetales bacterium]